MSNIFRGSSDREEKGNKENEGRGERHEKRGSKPSGIEKVSNDGLGDIRKHRALSAVCCRYQHTRRRRCDEGRV
jgi:hypothetical protein